MTENSEAQIRRVYDQWHQMTLKRDIEGIAALYAEDGIFESPAVMVLNAGSDGILRGRAEIRAYFETFFRKLDKDVAEWYRDGTYFSNGKVLQWEYPRQTPQGNQTDILESMDLKDGLIAHHRVYWGWVGVKKLLDTLKK